MYICNALKHHGYSAFFLTIFKYIDISSLTLEDAKIYILEREQFYLDTIEPEYNILKVAGSFLGHKLSEETKAKISQALKGRSFSVETKALISEALKGEKKSNVRENSFY